MIQNTAAYGQPNCTSWLGACHVLDFTWNSWESRKFHSNIVFCFQWWNCRLSTKSKWLILVSHWLLRLINLVFEWPIRAHILSAKKSGSEGWSVIVIDGCYFPTFSKSYHISSSLIYEVWDYVCLEKNWLKVFKKFIRLSRNKSQYWPRGAPKHA